MRVDGTVLAGVPWLAAWLCSTPVACPLSGYYIVPFPFKAVARDALYIVLPALFEEGKFVGFVFLLRRESLCLDAYLRADGNSC